MQTIKDLKAKAQAAVDRQKALSDLATTEKRELTDAENAEFDGLSASIDSALADIERLKQVEDRRAKIAAISTEAKDVTGVVDRIVQPTQA